MVDLAAFHPDHLAAGLAAAVLGVGAMAATRRRPLSVAGADLAAMVVAGWLWRAEQLPGLVPVALAALAVSGVVRRAELPRAVATVVAMLGAVGLAVGRPDLPAGARALLVLGLVGTLGPAVWTDRPRDDLPTSWLIGAALAATFAGGPDTEATVAAGAALVPVLAIGGFIARGDEPLARPPVPVAALGLATWVAVDAYRGRPAGLSAAAVALAVLGLAAVVAVPRPTMLGRLAARVPRWMVLGATASAAIGAARTIGLATAASPAATVVGAVLAAATISSGAVSSPPAGARTPPA